jgi:hypothetical protein
LGVVEKHVEKVAVLVTCDLFGATGAQPVASGMVPFCVR